jgi:hypothetical protein
MCNTWNVSKKVRKRKMPVTKKRFLIFYALLSLLVIPVCVSAEVLQDQPVRLVSLNDLLTSAAMNSATGESDESFDQDEEPFMIFAGPVSEGYALSDAALGSEGPRKPAKMKVLTCHVTTNTQDTMRTIFPWVATGKKVAHIAFFEILNKSDFVKFKITLQGPEFSKPLILETLTFGPQEPLLQWGIGFWRTYSVPGIYKIKMTAIPETNHTSGRSSIECSFRVSES